MKFLYSCLLIGMAFLTMGADSADERFQNPGESERATFQIEVVTEGLELPWGMAFLPDGRALLTQRRPSILSIIDLETGQMASLGGLPGTYTQADAGLKDVVLHPDYAENGWIYFSYSRGDENGSTLVVDRARIRDNTLVDRENIYTVQKLATWEDHWYHYGARLGFHDGFLFISVGDRHNRYLAQDLSAANGSFLRLNEDGSIPEDNPFTGTEGALPEIWSYGHRNPQGFAFHPETGALWSTEHGPRGADEINIIEPGKNYGWPVITHGVEYTGEPVGAGLTEQEGMEQPVFYYTPAVAPSDLMFYTGDKFPGWKMSAFFGSMSQRHLRRIEIEDRRIIHEEILLPELEQRIRFIRQGPEGFLYVATDDGLLLCLVPVGGE